MLNKIVISSKWRRGRVQIRQPFETLESKNFPLYWADSTSRKEELETLHERIPTWTVDGPGMRCFAGAEWRDRIRTLDDFQRLGIKLLIMVFQWQENDVDEDMNLLDEDWHKAQQLFSRLLQNADEGESTEKRIRKGEPGG